MMGSVLQAIVAHCHEINCAKAGTIISITTPYLVIIDRSTNVFGNSTYLESSSFYLP
jgi:hypothetical protein